MKLIILLLGHIIPHAVCSSNLNCDCNCQFCAFSFCNVK